ncbi:MAG: universal stress protein [Deltaproteobacteria bacterium]|nr:universal stress protein [Deltaproteobacteria bacterium]
MNEKTGKEILVATDGSDFAFETTKYISKIPSFKGKQINLFSVCTKIPGRYWDLQQEAAYSGKVTEILAWEARQRQECEGYMEKAKQILLDAGFSDKSVSIKLHEMERGIARDIIREAGKGYKALVVGKRGASRIKGLVLGSIANKLLQRVSFIPLFLVGRDPRPGKYLVAFDGSEGSLRAVDCVGTMLGGPDCEINLTHVIRYREDEKGLIAEAEKMIAAAFDEAIERLADSGIPRTHISTQIITGAKSRAGTIVDEAGLGDYGTIVIGRRGLSRVDDFSMGRVSNKVIQIAKRHAVWVVN